MADLDEYKMNFISCSETILESVKSINAISGDSDSTKELRESLKKKISEEFNTMTRLYQVIIKDLTKVITQKPGTIKANDHISRARNQKNVIVQIMNKTYQLLTKPKT